MSGEEGDKEVGKPKPIETHGLALDLILTERLCEIDLNSFRAALTTLQKQVSDLDQLKAEYYTEVLAHEEETWDAAMEKVRCVCLQRGNPPNKQNISSRSLCHC